MSNTYRNCNKNGKPNDFALSFVKFLSNRSRYENHDKKFLDFLTSEKDPGDMTVPKKHTKLLNRAQRTKDKHKLQKALKNDVFDNWSNDKWFKDAHHTYW